MVKPQGEGWFISHGSPPSERHYCRLPFVPPWVEVGAVWQCWTCRTRWKLTALPPEHHPRPRDPLVQRPSIVTGCGPDGAEWKTRRRWFRADPTAAPVPVTIPGSPKVP